MTKKCIICQNDIVDKNALRVKEDFVIATIRKIKTVLGVATGNELYVCVKDIETHQKKRKAYEQSIIVFTIIGAVVFVFLIALPILSGRFDLMFIAASLFSSGLIIIIPIFFKYVPAAEIKVEEAHLKLNKIKKGDVNAAPKGKRRTA